jgi:hypothetical protein
MYGVQAFFFSRRNTLEDKDERAAGGTNIDRLVARVEHKNGFLESVTRHD